MLNYSRSACTAAPAEPESRFTTLFFGKLRIKTTWLAFGAAILLVTVPVFVQAPLVREVPLLSLAMTAGWLALSFNLLNRPATWQWGDLLLGFTWTWFTGGIYWGWMRWEPLLHLPVEAALVPVALWYLQQGKGKIGNWFYLGSLFGTAVTDGYFWMTGLMPYWRQLMRVADVEAAIPIFQNAIATANTPWGISSAAVLALVLTAIGVWPLRSQQLHWWAFGGAVLGTILVDSLFLVAAPAG